MKTFLRIASGLVAVALSIAAVCFFTLWVAETDVMFGHFKGPPRFILTALGLAVAAGLLSVGWLLAALYDRIRRGQPSTVGRASRVVLIFETILLVLLLFPNTIIALAGASEFADARLKLRRQRATVMPKQGRSEVTDLIEMLQDDDYLVRMNAAESLGRLGSAAAPALPALIKALEDKQDFVSGAAARTLGAMGPTAAPAVPALAEALKQGAYRTPPGDEAALPDAMCVFAGNALADIGPAAVPALSELLTDENALARAQAVDAVGRMGAHAAPLIPHLQEMRNDPSELVRNAAEKSLDWLGVSTGRE